MVKHQFPVLTIKQSREASVVLVFFGSFRGCKMCRGLLYLLGVGQAHSMPKQVPGTLKNNLFSILINIKNSLSQ